MVKEVIQARIDKFLKWKPGQEFKRFEKANSLGSLSFQCLHLCKVLPVLLGVVPVMDMKLD